MEIKKYSTWINEAKSNIEIELFILECLKSFNPVENGLITNNFFWATHRIQRWLIEPKNGEEQKIWFQEPFSDDGIPDIMVDIQKENISAIKKDVYLINQHLKLYQMEVIHIRHNNITVRLILPFFKEFILPVYPSKETKERFNIKINNASAEIHNKMVESVVNFYKVIQPNGIKQLETKFRGNIKGNKFGI